MEGHKGMWILVVLFLSSSLFADAKVDCRAHSHETSQITQNIQAIDVLFKNDEVLKTNMFSKVERAYNHRATQLMRVFNLGELSISSPYLPFCQNEMDSTSQASVNLNIPEEWGGFRVHGGITFQVENQRDKRSSSPQEHMVYFVSTKNIAENKWKPFVTLSYVRSQVRDISQARKARHERMRSDSFSSQARYSNTEAMGTCCGMQPLENLSMILSYNYIKPLHKGVRLSNHNTKVFDDLKIASHNQNVDFKLDYAVRDGLNLLVKSEYLVPNGTLRDTVDAPVLIEGQLIVSF